MTHDELLANLSSPQFQNSRTLDTPYAALRAAVELHKPQVIEIEGEFYDQCASWACSRQYPCPTIQAIEKELA